MNLVDAVFAALGEQTVTVIGTEAVELVISRSLNQSAPASGLKSRRGTKSSQDPATPEEQRSGF